MQQGIGKGESSWTMHRFEQSQSATVIRPPSDSDGIDATVVRDQERRGWTYVVYFLILAALVGGLLAYFLAYTHQQTERSIEESCANEAHVIANQVDSMLRRIDATTALIAERFREDLLGAELSAARAAQIETELAALARNFPEGAGYLVFDGTAGNAWPAIRATVPSTSPTATISSPVSPRPAPNCASPRRSSAGTPDSASCRPIAL
jgi:hypothetical protein